MLRRLLGTASRMAKRGSGPRPGAAPGAGPAGPAGRPRAGGGSDIQRGARTLLRGLKRRR